MRRPPSRCSRRTPDPGDPLFEVLAVPPVGACRPLGGPVLRAVGLARGNPDGTIAVWLDATPTSGELLLRPSHGPAELAASGERRPSPAVPADAARAQASAIFGGWQ